VAYFASFSAEFSEPNLSQKQVEKSFPDFPETGVFA
jgi:hypothetical protein